MGSKSTQNYLNNPNLPAEGAVHEYDAEKVKELKKCTSNMLYFAENYFYIRNVDEGKIKIKLHKYQKRILKKLKEHRFFVLLSGRQIGKALDVNTPIPTPNGFVKMGDLKPGDKVYGSNGNIITVTHAHDVLYDRKCYKIIFDNGEEIVADEDHRWFTQSSDERLKGIDGTIKLTKDIYNTIHKKHSDEPNHRIPSAIFGVENTEKCLPIDPYILGLWLGGGDTSSGAITIGSRDVAEVLDSIKSRKQFDKVSIKEYSTSAYTVRLSTTYNVGDSLSSLLSTLGLKHNKHIPKEYLLASREQRLELLRGLIDSGGYVSNKGICQFYNTNIQLVNQVRELIESLGYKVTQKKYTPKLYGVECAEASVLTFTPIEYVCTISSKKQRIRLEPHKVDSKYRTQWHYIKDVIPVDSVPVRCITVDAPDSLFLCGRQYIPTGNSTLMTIYALWIACFQESQNVLIVANKESTAVEILKRIKLAYEELPNWIKPGVKKWAETSVIFENKSEILISTTTSSAARGMSINCLIIDEAAFIEPASMLEAFWRSVFPVVSSSKKAKIFMVSTPNGTGNLFHHIYSEAETGKNGWGFDRVDWREVPGRDEKWKRDMIMLMGDYNSYLQEFEAVFLDSGESTVNQELYDRLKNYVKDPLYVMDQGCYKIFEEPKDDRIYVVGVDTSEGLGQDYSVINIFDITDLTSIKQVAVYANNQITPQLFLKKLDEVLTQWGKPLVCIERNNQGALIVDNLRGIYQYENIVCWGASEAGRAKSQLGIISHTNTKGKGVTNMRYWVNTLRCVEFRDVNTLKELRDFVRYPNGTWAAKKGANYHDDLVMSMVWALIVLEDSLVQRYFEVVRVDENKRPLEIKPLDFGIKYNVLPHTMYNENDMSGGGMPTIIGGDYGFADSEMNWLQSQGWKPLQ